MRNEEGRLLRARLFQRVHYLARVFDAFSSRPASIALIIPARDEASNLPPLVEALRAVRAVYPPLGRIILVDNGSRDGTGALAAEAGLEVVHEPRAGYGGACLAGLARLEEGVEPGVVGMEPGVVAFLDADLADDPMNLPRLCDPILSGEADVVLGSRQALAEPGALDPHQRFGNRLATGLLRWTTGHQYRDVGPFRAVSWEALRSMEMRDRTWGWTVELQFKAARAGLRVLEVDLPYRRRHSGRSKISGSLVGSARAGTKIIATIARLWWRAS